MTKQALLDILFGALITALLAHTLGLARANMSNSTFRLIISASAALLILLASIIWKTEMLVWLIGPSPTFFPAALVILAIAAIQSLAAPSGLVEAQRLSPISRSALASLPVELAWNEKIIAWALEVSQSHQCIAADRVHLSVKHRTNATSSFSEDILNHWVYDYELTLIYDDPVNRTVCLSIEIAPEIMPPLLHQTQYERFSPMFSGARHKLYGYGSITLHPLVETQDFAKNQLRIAEVIVEARDSSGKWRNIASSLNQIITNTEGIGPPFTTTARRLLFSIALDRPTSQIRVIARNLFHTQNMPFIYFQPECVALNEWEFEAETSNNISISSPSIVDNQMPLEGEINISERLRLRCRGGLQIVNGVSVRLPVMPWTTVHYKLSNIN